MACRGITTPTRIVTQRGWLSLCLFAVLTGGAQNAWATCGDYLHGHMDHHVNHHVLFAEPDFGRPAVPSRPICSGPRCQQNRQIPAVPTKAIPTLTFADAILSSLVVLSNTDDDSFVPVPDVDQLTGELGRIFRPPRAAQ